MSALVDVDDVSFASARAIRAVLRTLAHFPAADVQHALEYTVVARATSGGAVSACPSGTSASTARYAAACSRSSA